MSAMTMVSYRLYYFSIFFESFVSNCRCIAMQILRKYFLFLLWIPTFCFGQSKNEETIEWKSSRLLTWTDYKANPDPNSDAAASTTTYLGVEYNMDQKGLTWKIQCLFSITRSWGRHKDDFVLKHEQGHFDIAEIYARKLNQRLKDYKFNNTTFKDDLKTIYTTITSEKEAFQDQYDNETDHSRKKEVQVEWLKKITKMLDDLKDYSSYR